MPRNRMIKPDFWIDEKLSEVSRDARLLYIGLWSFSYDNGVQEYNPRKIKAQIFPYDNLDIEILLNELIGKFVTIYDNKNGKKLLYINNFNKHQVINRPSTIPEEYSLLPDSSLSTHLPLIDKVKLKEVKLNKKKLNKELLASSVKKQTDSRIKILVDYYYKHLQEVFQEKSPVCSFGILGKNIQSLLKQNQSEQNIKVAMDNYFKSIDKFVVLGGYKPGIFFGLYNVCKLGVPGNNIKTKIDELKPKMKTIDEMMRESREKQMDKDRKHNVPKKENIVMEIINQIGGKQNV